MPITRKKRPWGNGLNRFFGLKISEEMKEGIERESRFARITESEFVRTAIEVRINHLRSIRQDIAKGDNPPARPDTLSSSEMRRVQARRELAEAVRRSTGP